MADTNRTRRIWVVGTIVEPWGQQLNAGKEDLSLGDCSDTGTGRPSLYLACGFLVPKPSCFCSASC